MSTSCCPCDSMGGSELAARISSSCPTTNTTATATPSRAARRLSLSDRGAATATHRQPASTAARNTALAGGRYWVAAGSWTRKITVMVMAAATPPVTRRVGAGTGNRMRRQRATARTTMAPTSPTKLGAKVPSPGTAASAVRAAATTAATTTPAVPISSLRRTRIMHNSI